MDSQNNNIMKHFALIYCTALILLSACSTKTGGVRQLVGIDTAEYLSDELSIKVVNDSGNYSKKILEVCTVRDPNAHHVSYYSNSSELEAYNRWISDLLSNGLSDINHTHPHLYLYAGISKGAKVHADKDLYGRAAGSDIGDLLTIPYYRNDIIVQYPDFHILYGHDDQLPKTFRELTSNSIALSWIESPIVILELPETDMESNEEVTITFEIPVNVEYYESYPPEIYESGKLRPEGIRTLKGSVKIIF